ncbi:hypothetical protein ElyMa_002485600 [Elysia marginata]|uniref:C2H2-type domain-containing protein n=1 Tax=Elysia marginata TaxID=1093978 RepID=A0AAV4GQ04_9GAST|nr:hypothetical protein ElyMa_002485600 [Elysia marginata]
MNKTVSEFELDSLYEAYAKTCIQFKALKDDYGSLKSDFDKIQADLEEANKQLLVQATQLDDEKIQLHRLKQLTAQHLILNCILLGKVSVGMEEKVTQTSPYPPQLMPRQAERDQADIEPQKPAHNESVEAELREKLAKMEAMYDIIKRENESTKRQMAKLTSKLRILSEENEYLDKSLGTTIHKQGRFVVRKYLECDRCYQGFSSQEEMEKSTCRYHPKHAVPHDGPDGRKYYYLCCSEPVKKGQASGCCTGRHILNLKNG